MTRLTQFILGASLGLIATTATPETEDGLYGAPVPHDAVFIRQIGGVSEPTELLGRRFDAEELPDGVYAAISASALTDVEPGRHYTVLAAQPDLPLVPEPTRDDPAKVHLLLLNADAAEARLLVAGGGPTVIEATGPGQIAARAVNPVAVTLSVEADGSSQDFDLVLRRGVNLTFLVSQGQIALIENRFGPVIETD